MTAQLKHVKYNHDEMWENCGGKTQKEIRMTHHSRLTKTFFYQKIILRKEKIFFDKMSKIFCFNKKMNFLLVQDFCVIYVIFFCLLQSWFFFTVFKFNLLYRLHLKKRNHWIINRLMTNFSWIISRKLK